MTEDISNPSDMRQAAIGIGMGIFTRYSGVVNADGSRMTVREALQEISRAVDEMLDSSLADMDPVTRWVVQWMEMHGTKPGPSHQADQLAQTKGLAMDSDALRAVTITKGGKTRLRTVAEFLRHQPPLTMKMSRYAMGRFMAIAMEGEGEQGAAAVLWSIDERDWEPIPVLAARIFRISEPPISKLTADEAHPWHALASAWPEIVKLARKGPDREEIRQAVLDADPAELKRRALELDDSELQQLCPGMDVKEIRRMVRDLDEKTSIGSRRQCGYE